MKTLKLDSMIESKTTEQLKDMVNLSWTSEAKEAALVRARIYSRLCETVGDEEADKIFESMN